MRETSSSSVTSVVSLWRYPVKSMMGEELNAVELSDRGLRGDRAYALVDDSDGKAATAKNPRKWPGLFDYRAALVDTAQGERGGSPVRITLPDGTSILSTQPDADEILSHALNRRVTLTAAGQSNDAALSVRSDPPSTIAEEYWPDMEGLDFRDTVTEFSMPEGTFFDCAVVHLLTTATLDRLRQLYPEGRFETRRFRPNIVLRPSSGEAAFVENGWIDRTLAIGDEVRLKITGPCLRCVMTTLAQSDLPWDPGVLRTAVQHNRGAVGVYASVLRGGSVKRGDRVELLVS